MRSAKATRFTTLRRKVTRKRSSSTQDNYRRNLRQILSPMTTKGSKQKCDNLVGVYNEIKNPKRKINPEILTINEYSKIRDLFISDLRVNLVNRAFKKSGLATADLFTVYKKILRNYRVGNQCEFSVQDPFIITSKTTYAKNTLKANMYSVNPGKKQLFNRCLSDPSINYLVGFINLYAKRFKGIGVVDHKNAVIIDKTNKKIIRFEPKKKDAMFLKYVRHDITENEVKEKLAGYGLEPDILRTYEYIIIRGNQPNMSMSNDSMYCAVYSLYAALLFAINYHKLN